jgi:hypothetical protein
MMSNAAFDTANERTIVWFADYRKSKPPGDDERPPPAPYPAAARRPEPPISVEARASYASLPREFMLAA